LTNRDLDFIVGVAPSWDKLQVPDLAFVPICFGGVAITYNIPNLPQNSPPLVLSRDVVIDIFRGLITNWNDPQIQNTNPSLVPFLPNATISLLLSEEPTVTTAILGHTFGLISSNWTTEYGNYAETTGLWPPNFYNRSNAIPLSGAAAELGTLDDIPNSLGALSISLALQWTANMASIVNKAGNVVSPLSLSQLSTQVQINSSQLLTLSFDVADAAGPYAYPFAMPLFVGWNNSDQTNCTKRRELLKFLRWAVSSNIAVARTVESGFGSLGSASQDVESTLFTFLCGGAEVLSLTILPQRQSGAYIAITVLSFFFLVITIGTTFVIFKLVPFHDESHKLEFFYNLVLVVGSLFCYVSIVFWYLIPNVAAICSLRQWFTALGATIVLASIFARTWHLHKIHHLIHKKNQILLKRRTLFGIILIMFSAICAQIGILGLWTGLNPLTANLLIVDSFNLLAEWECVGLNISIWLGVEFAFVGLLLILGLWIVYHVWSLKDKITERRWLLVSVYNIALTLFVLALILPTIAINDDILSLVASLAIFFATTSVIVCIYGPKLFVLIKDTTKCLYIAKSKHRFRRKHNFNNKTRNHLSSKPNSDYDVKGNDRHVEFQCVKGAEVKHTTTTTTKKKTPRKSLKETENNEGTTSTVLRKRNSNHSRQKRTKKPSEQRKTTTTPRQHSSKNISLATRKDTEESPLSLPIRKPIANSGRARSRSEPQTPPRMKRQNSDLEIQALPPSLPPPPPPLQDGLIESLSYQPQQEKVLPLQAPVNSKQMSSKKSTKINNLYNTPKTTECLTPHLSTPSDAQQQNTQLDSKTLSSEDKHSVNVSTMRTDISAVTCIVHSSIDLSEE
jgi:ABC-type phosphate transport system substrate-binding protein